MAQTFQVPTRSLGLKFLLVCALVLVLALPTLAVWGVLMDRQGRANQVSSELAARVGGMQTVLGPVLLVPWSKDVRDEAGKVTSVSGDAVIFAETGEASAKLTTEVLRRGIYKVPKFNAVTELKASFAPAGGLAALAKADPAARFDAANARLVVGVSQAVGVQESIALTLPGGESRRLKPIATGGGGFVLYAADAGDVAAAPAAVAVAARIALSGAERFSIASFAKDTKAEISGDWPDPSFEGGFVPDKRTVNGVTGDGALDAAAPAPTAGALGFTANWSAPLERRGVASESLDAGVLQMTQEKDFAVRLVEKTTPYTGVDRALKYALMFIGLVFLTYFMFEVVSGLKAHPAQYIMVGVSQAIFYLLLLAFAERMGFDIAFLIAAGLTVTLITLYVGVVFKKAVYLVPAAAAFIGLYGLMYVLMQMDDYALIVGALTSFAALAILMYLTRNVDWYAANEAASAPPTRTGG